MLGWILAACVLEPHTPDAWAPTPTSSASTGDTAALVETEASPPGWGTCATLRSASLLTGPDDEGLTEVSQAPGGAVDLVGWFSGPLVLDPGGPHQASLAPVGESASLLARYGSEGALVWFRTLNGTAQATISASEPTLDGGVFVAGTGDALSAFDGGPALGDIGEADAFLARFGAGGDLLWTRSAGSPGDDSVGELAGLPDGGVLVGGSYAGEMVLGRGEPAETLLSLPAGAERASFLARYTSEGVLVWAVSAGGASETTLHDLVYNKEQNTILVLGSLEGEGATIFGEGTAQERVIEPAVHDTYVAVYGGDGRFRWVSDAGGGSVYGRGVIWVTSGSVLSVGTASNGATFGRGEPTEQTLQSPLDVVAWLARYTDAGQFDGLSILESPEYVDISAVTALPGGGAILLGAFRMSVTLGRGEPHETHFVSESGRDIFLATIDAQGQLGCAVQLEAEGSSDYLVPYAMARRDDGGIDLVGYLDGTATLGGEAGVSLTSAERDGLRVTLDLVSLPQ